VCHEANARRRRTPPPRRIENRIAEQLPPGARKDAHRQKARDHESSAHSNDWRDSNLHKPE
jgi:hypothetical protein